jgi:hypothetical protein
MAQAVTRLQLRSIHAAFIDLISLPFFATIAGRRDIFPPRGCSSPAA